MRIAHSFQHACISHPPPTWISGGSTGCLAALSASAPGPLEPHTHSRPPRWRVGCAVAQARRLAVALACAASSLCTCQEGAKNEGACACVDTALGST